MTEVVIDGEPLARDAWYLEGNLLTRIDGQAWPTWQDLNALPRSYGTWEVTYIQGVPVPEGGQIAAGVLANELARYLCNDSGCQLPKRVTSITRNDMSMTLLDGFEGLNEGRTGIWIVDSWISSITKPPQFGGRVYSVDVPRRRVYR